MFHYRKKNNKPLRQALNLAENNIDLQKYSLLMYRVSMYVQSNMFKSNIKL